MQNSSQNSSGENYEMPEPSLSHVDADGEARMVDVSAKAAAVREAIAIGRVRLGREAFAAIAAGNAPKGNVLATAKLAGIMAAKQTAHLIPLCHPLPLQKIDVTLTPDRDLPGYRIRAAVKTKAETGVEMEALTAVSVAALTLYDMAKALDKEIVIEGICLLEKTGGRSGAYRRPSQLDSFR